MVQYRYKDWQGQVKKSTKRGFRTKRDAEIWLRTFLLRKSDDLDMRFSDFIELYREDMSVRLKENTMVTKNNILNTKILPYFGQMPVKDITVTKIRKWQDEMIQKGYTPTYLKTINNQLSAVFNYACCYYNLKENPCHKAGSMGKSRAGEMQYWTLEEFQEFEDCIIDKRLSWLAFRTLFWTGMRIGELLALTFGDVDLDRKMISITKSYQRLSGKDVITKPKTEKSIRKVTIPEFLAEDFRDFIEDIYDPAPENRIFPVTKHYLEHEMKRGIALSGVKKIRLHDIRHSHASMLINLGVSPKEIADRLGHERVETTLNTYAHMYPDKQNQIAVRLNELEGVS